MSTNRSFSVLKTYLQLVRMPNVFTAAADSLAGWLLTTGSFGSPGRWLPLCGASMAIYAGGIALNDVYDREIDRAERPGRPIPSGRIGVPTASVLGLTLLALGLVLAAIGSWRESGLVAVMLVACVLAYDAGLKRWWIGPIVMGSCRGLNLMLGMSQSPHWGGPIGWLVAGSITVFVAGVTWLSRSETGEGSRIGRAAGWALQELGLLGLAGAAIRAGQEPWAGLIVLAGVAVVVNRATARAVFEPLPSRLQTAVKTGVFALIWLNVGIIAAVRGPVQALAVAALWFPAFGLGKWIYST